MPKFLTELYCLNTSNAVSTYRAAGNREEIFFSENNNSLLNADDDLVNDLFQKSTHRELLSLLHAFQGRGEGEITCFFFSK